MAQFSRTENQTSAAFASAGFTLIEIMVVIAIIAGVLAAVAPRAFDSSAQKRSEIRNFAIMTKEIRNNARLTNSTMRIVINMNDEKGHTYWIESAPGNATMLSAAQKKELDSMTELQREDEGIKSEFSQDSRILKKPRQLPRGLFFESVENATLSEPITSGIAYIHFFPQGLAEEVAIHLTDRKTLNWTITINPLTGRADVFERKISLKELHDK